MTLSERRISRHGWLVLREYLQREVSYQDDLVVMRLASIGKLWMQHKGQLLQLTHFGLRAGIAHGPCKALSLHDDECVIV